MCHFTVIRTPPASYLWKGGQKWVGIFSARRAAFYGKVYKEHCFIAISLRRPTLLTTTVQVCDSHSLADKHKCTFFTLDVLDGLNFHGSQKEVNIICSN